MSQTYLSRDDRSRRQNAVFNVLDQKLTNEEREEAIRICDENFDKDRDFTASDFCQLLVETNPEVKLGKETRLLLLQGIRQCDVKLESDLEQQAIQSTTITPETQNMSSENLKHGIPERRRNFRKITNLMGVYWCTLDKQINGSMVVENLSLDGCGLRILTPHHLKRGEMLRLEFKLDNASETLIRIHGRLRWVLYDLVGFEFQSPYGTPQVIADYIAE